MDMDSSTLFANVVVSAVGVGIFIYGKKQRRVPQLVTGVLLGVFPYFVNGALLTYAIAVALIAAMWIAVRRGF